ALLLGVALELVEPFDLLAAVIADEADGLERRRIAAGLVLEAGLLDLQGEVVRLQRDGLVHALEAQLRRRGELCGELSRLRRIRIRLREVIEEADRSLAVAAPCLRICQGDGRVLAVRLVVDV